MSEISLQWYTPCWGWLSDVGLQAFPPGGRQDVGGQVVSVC